MYTLATLKIAFIGGGNMARALIGGLLAKGARPENIIVAEPMALSRDELVQQFSVRVTDDNNVAAASASVLVLAVKPQIMSDVARSLADSITRTHPLVISVAAGIAARDLNRWLGADIPVVRAMPNRPALIGAGATGLFADPGVDVDQRNLASFVLESTGLCLWVRSEAEIDLVTALSGSGPAYFFRLAELMAQAAVAQGLDPVTAGALAAQTLAGAGKLVAAEKSPDLARMRAEVTSKGGTTEAALSAFADRQLGAIVAAAQAAATARSKEMAAQFGAL
jgi:pyrroline-5-carboxylate reductase